VYPHAMPVPFLERAIVSFMRKVEREEVVAGVRVGFSNKVVRRANEVEAVGVEGPCFSQVGKRANNAVVTDLQRKT
jgi:hypothetical protein